MKSRLNAGNRFGPAILQILHGAKEDVQTTRFDCRVSGSEAEKLIKRCEQAEKEHKKILIGFKLGDLYAETFVYEKGDKKGQTGVSLKARLLFISWIKVDGDMVYKAPARPEATETSNESSEPAFEQSLQAA